MVKKIIDDVGEKIGGARKDLYGSFNRTYLESLHIEEISNLATKNKIWRTSTKDYEDKNADFFSLMMLKEIKKSIPKIPFIIKPNSRDNLPHLKAENDRFVKEAFIQYANAVAQIRDISLDRHTFQKNGFEVLRNIMDFYKNSSEKNLLDNNKIEAYTSRVMSYVVPQYPDVDLKNKEQTNLVEEEFKTDFKNSKNVFSFFLAKKVKINEHAISYLANYEYLFSIVFVNLLKHCKLQKNFVYVKNGVEHHFDAMQDSAFYNFLNKLNEYRRKQNYSLTINEYLDELLKDEDIKAKLNCVAHHMLTGKMIFEEDFENKNDLNENNLSNNEVVVKEKSIEEQKKDEIKEIKNNIKQHEVAHLAKVERVGYKWRDDVNSEDFLKVFGFRAVEFGESLPNKERQVVVNLAYDSLCDMALALSIDRKDLAIKFNEDKTLALAFGSRGIRNAKAHFEPHRKVINMTRLKGAGSLAHELWHAIESAINGGQILNETFTDATHKDSCKITSDFLHQLYWEDFSKDKMIDKHIKKNKDEYNDTVREYIYTFNKDFGFEEWFRKIPAHRANMDKILTPYLDKFFEKNHQENGVTLDNFIINGRSTEFISMFEGYVEHNDFPHPYKKLSYKGIVNKIKEQVEVDFPEVKGFTRTNHERFMNNFITLCANQLRISILERARGNEFDFSEQMRNVKINTQFYNAACFIDSRYGKHYYSQPTEMGARAFALYINNKLKEKGLRNDYLTTSTPHDFFEAVETDYYSGKFNVNKIYFSPNEQEMAKFTPFFDKFIAENFNQIDLTNEIANREIISSHHNLKKEQSEKTKEMKELVGKVEKAQVEAQSAPEKTPSNEIKNDIDVETKKPKTYQKPTQLDLFG